MIKLFITELAIRKQEMESKLHNVTPAVAQHLIKCFLMPNSTAYEHWKLEIFNFLHEVKVLKGVNKFPSSQQIYEWTYGSYCDSITNRNWMKSFLGDMEYSYDIKITYNLSNIIKNIDDLCIDYFTWLSTKLSKYGYVDRKLICKKIDNLIKNCV